MVKNLLVLLSSIVLSSSAYSFEGTKTFMPPNSLNKSSTLEAGTGLTQAQFNGVIDKLELVYKPIVQQFGATLSVERRWTDETVNASADQPTPTTWQVHMYGGLARRAEVTEDGFAMVICHEFGHHLGGFPYVQDWAADEGQSDMHATGACAYKVFQPNARLSAVAEASVPQALKDKCDAAHSDAGERDICYRAIVAGKSLADLLGALGGTPVAYDTPDTSVVTKTNHAHPAAQCRLDTYIAGAVCGNEKWDYTLIPGKALDHRSVEAQNEAYAHSCAEGPGARPTCWFKELSGDEPEPEECPLGDPAICELLCSFDPTLPWCP